VTADGSGLIREVTSDGSGLIRERQLYTIVVTSIKHQ
jgi:hypothetical protein